MSSASAMALEEEEDDDRDLDRERDRDCVAERRLREKAVGALTDCGGTATS